MRVALVAGELSGDTLGAGLIQALSRHWPEATFEGVGGEKMRAAGMQTWHDCEVLAVMGLTEVLKHLPRLLKLRRELKDRWQANPPDVFIGIDAPDFNLGLELRLRRLGIPTVHYVSPSVWAWREKRVKTIAKACDRVLCLLPFEPAFYARHNVTADFVGHPLANAITPVTDLRDRKMALNLDPEHSVVTVLPGSRRGEIEKLGNDFAATARRLTADNPMLNILVPLANEAGATQFRQLPEAQTLPDNIRLSVANADDCIQAADVLLCASGTVTLEGLLYGKPMVVAYRLAPTTYRIVRLFKLFKLAYFSLPNLLTKTPLVPEFIQDAVAPQALSAQIQALLDNPVRRAEIVSAFAAVHERLAQDANERAAQAVMETVASHV